MNLIHYGDTRFSRRKFQPIRDINFIKPDGGLWASPVDAAYGWKDWCLSEQFRCECLEKSFLFHIEGNILRIDSIADLDQLQWGDSLGIGWISPLYEPLLASGVDAIHLTDNGQRETRFSRPGLYGWDCESVLVLNANCVCIESAASKPCAKSAKVRARRTSQC